MDANDLEDNDWVQDVLDLGVFDDNDEEEYNLGELAENPENEAQRIYFERLIAREERPEEEIEALGIRPDVPSIILHMNQWEEDVRSGAHQGRMIPSFPNLSDRVRRVYHRSYRNHTSSSDDDEESEDEEAAFAKQEEEFETAWQSELIENGLEDSNPFLQREYRAISRERFLSLKQTIKAWKAAQKPPKTPNSKIDLLSTLCTTPELLIEVCKHLRPKDIVNLYALHRRFHDTLNYNMRTFVFAWARSMAPVAAKIYSSPVYSHWFIPDPAGRLVTRSDQEMSLTQPGQASLGGGVDDDDGHHHQLLSLPLNKTTGEIRLIPGLFWLQHVVHREIRVRDILAVMARHGHRTLPKTNSTLQKIWLVLDCPTNSMRRDLFADEGFITDEDLYRFQLFFVKLILLTNDPIFGPGSTVLARLFLGQRGLSPLWKFLRRKGYHEEMEIRQLKLKYDVHPKNREIWRGQPVMGVQIYDMGVGQYEGWEKGGLSILMRPEELAMMEAERRGLGAMGGWEVLFGMMTYGHVDYKTGSNEVPSLEEMYMSDDDRLVGVEKVAGLHENEKVNGGCGNVPFERGMWLPKHARKRRWKELTEGEREEMVKEEEKEMARAERVNKAMDLYRLSRRKLEEMYNITAMGFKGERFKIKMPDPETDWKEDVQDVHQLLLFRIKVAMAVARAAPDKSMDELQESADNNGVDEDVDEAMDEDQAETKEGNGDDMNRDQNMDDDGYDAESEEFDDEGWEEYEDNPMEIDSPPSTIAFSPAPPPQSPPPSTLSDIINHDNHLDTIWSSPPNSSLPDPASFRALPVSEQYPLLFGSDIPSSQDLTPSHGAHAITQVTDHLPPQNHLWNPSSITLRQSTSGANGSSDLDFSDSELETISIPPIEISTFMSGQYMHPEPNITPPPPPESSSSSPSSSRPPQSSESSHELSPPQSQNIPIPALPPYIPVPGSPTSSTDPEDWLSDDSDRTTLNPSPSPPRLLPDRLVELQNMSVDEASRVIAREEDDALKALADEDYGSATEDDINDPDEGIDWEHYVNNMEVYRTGGGNSWSLQRVPVHRDWAEEQARSDEQQRYQQELTVRDVRLHDLWEGGRPQTDQSQPRPQSQQTPHTQGQQQQQGLVYHLHEALQQQQDHGGQQQISIQDPHTQLQDLLLQQATQPLPQPPQSLQPPQPQNQQPHTKIQKQRDPILPNLETIRRQRWPSPNDDFWESPRVKKARDWYPKW